MRHGRDWEAGLAPAQRKRLGQWLTPWWAIGPLLDEVLPGLPPGATVLDPACGDGRWLLAAGRRRPDLRLEGWDVDAGALDAAAANARAAGVALRLRQRDALDGDEAGVAELVVGNPPYVRPQALPEALRRRVWARYACATDKCDLYAPFTERMVGLSRGRLALVLADTWLSLGSFAALRAFLLAQPLALVARLPPRAFAAGVGTVGLVLRPGASPRRGRLDPEGLVDLGPLVAVDGLLPLEDPPALVGAGRLGERWRLRMGVVCGDYARWVHRGPPGPTCRPTLRGRDVQRFSARWAGEWLRYEPRAMLEARPYVAPKRAALFTQAQKLVLAGTSGRSLRAAVDSEGRFPLDSCYVSEPLVEGLDPWALCGLLNARVVNDWYGARHPAPRVKAVELHALPWPSGALQRLAEAARAADQDAVDAEAARAYLG